MDLIEQMLTIERCFDLICASETKLDNTIDNTKVNIKDYSLYRNEEIDKVVEKQYMYPETYSQLEIQT